MSDLGLHLWMTSQNMIPVDGEGIPGKASPRLVRLQSEKHNKNTERNEKISITSS